jgi:uncharacterized protein YggE
MTRTRGILGFAVVVAMISLASSEVAAAEPPSTIRVMTQSTVAVKPDRAELEVGVTTDKKTAAAATAENARKMEQVLAVLKKEVGAGGEVRTSQLSVSPRFGESRSGQPMPILGYTATNTVQVRLADIKAVGRLLDLALQAGANLVERVQFTLQDPEAAQNEALRAASAKARLRATAMADGLGLRVGQILAVSEGEADDPYSPIGGRRMKYDKSRANAAAIEPGSVEVTATVTVVFALASAR